MLDTCVKIARRTRSQTAHSPMSQWALSLARPTRVSFVHPNHGANSVLSKVDEENDDFETVETNPSSAHPKDYEASQAPRPRNQNPELRTRPGRKLNLEDKTPSTFSPAEPQNRKVLGFSDQDLAFASQPRLPMTTRSAT